MPFRIRHSRKPLSRGILCICRRNAVRSDLWRTRIIIVGRSRGTAPYGERVFVVKLPSWAWHLVCIAAWWALFQLGTTAAGLAVATYGGAALFVADAVILASAAFAFAWGGARLGAPATIWEDVLLVEAVYALWIVPLEAIANGARFGLLAALAALLPVPLALAGSRLGRRRLVGPESPAGDPPNNRIQQNAAS